MEIYIKVRREIACYVEEEYAVAAAILPSNWSEMDKDEQFSWVQENETDRQDNVEEVLSTTEVHEVDVVGAW